MLELESIVAAAGLPDSGKNAWDEIASHSRQSSQSSSGGRLSEDMNATIGDMLGGVEQSSQQKYRQGSNVQIYGRGNIPRIQLSQPPLFSMTPEARTPRFQYPFPPRDSPRWQNPSMLPASHISMSPTDVRSTTRNEFPFPQQYVPPPQRNTIQQDFAPQTSMPASALGDAAQLNYAFPQQYPPSQQDQIMQATRMVSLEGQTTSQPQSEYPSFAQQYPPQQNPFDFPVPSSYQDMAAASIGPANVNIANNEYTYSNIGSTSLVGQQNEDFRLPTATMGQPENFNLWNQDQNQGQNQGQGQGQGQNK